MIVMIGATACALLPSRTSPHCVDGASISTTTLYIINTFTT